jgi:hypothetical protein
LSAIDLEPQRITKNEIRATDRLAAALAEGRFPDARRLSLLVAMVVIVVALALIAFLIASSL